MGFVPTTHQPKCESLFLAVEACKKGFQDAWVQAVKSIIHTQSLWNKPLQYCPYQLGDQVWLNGSNLHMSYPMHKLCLKQFRPFMVTEKLGQ